MLKIFPGALRLINLDSILKEVLIFLKNTKDSKIFNDKSMQVEFNYTMEFTDAED